MSETISQGFVADGFESVRHVFEQPLKLHQEDKSQLCVYYKGRLVVDLWADVSACSSTKRPFDGDSLMMIFSSSKSLAAIAMAWLVDQDLLQYNEKVSKYWPEFGENGKDEVRMSDVLRHEAGLSYFDKSFAPSDLHRDGIKSNKAGQIVEKQTQHFPRSGNRRAYHGLTRGTILNEIFRRVDVQGRTIGEFYEQEIFLKGIKADCHLGITDKSIRERIEDIRGWSLRELLWQFFLPKFISNRVGLSRSDLFKMISAGKKMQKGQSLRSGEENDPKITNPKRAPPFFSELPRDLGKNIHSMLSILNGVEARAAEVPSANFHCSARGMAKMAACMAGRGSLDGFDLLRPETVANMEAEATPGMLFDTAFCTHFSQGGVNHFRVDEDEEPFFKETCALREGFVGWMGFGGSVMQWHPKLQLGVGFVSATARWFDFSNRRAAIVQAEIVKCAEKLEKSINIRFSSTEFFSTF